MLNLRNRIYEYMEIRIFISSVQKEFERERKSLFEYIQQDALLGKFFVPYIFEASPAQNISAATAYITEVKGCDIYIGIYGEHYGYEDNNGISPTEREYDSATENHKYRLVFIKDVEQRHPKESSFIKKVEKDVVRRSFSDYEQLQSAVYAALVRYLEEKEYLRLLPFDAAINSKATLEHIDEEKVRLFVAEAAEKRDFKIPFSAGIPAILTHLDLMTEDGRLTNSALLLFAKRPQSFFITSEVKCIQFYGTEVQKPIPSYQVYRGNIFELVDQAVGFVMSRIDAAVSARSKGAQADITYEIPVEAVTETIVNAITHRDYTSNGSVQVMLFKDRLEVWNPGRLPYGLTPEKLLKRHPSKPTNPTLANAVYLAGYIERVGTGTCDILDYCKKAGLRDPEFVEDEDFRVTIWRKSNQDEVKSNQDEAESNQDEATKSNQDDITSEGIKLSKKQKTVLDFCETPRTANEIFDLLGIKKQHASRIRYINTLIDCGLLRPTITQKSTSKNQKYVRTLLHK